MCRYYFMYRYDNFSQPHIGNPKLFIFSIYYHFTYHQKHHQNHHQNCWGFPKIPFWSFWQPQSFPCRGSCRERLPKVSILGGSRPSPPERRGGHQNGSFLKNPKHVKNFEFFLFFRFFSRFFHLVVMFFFVFFPIVFLFWWFPALLPQRSAEATKMADF